MPSAPLRLFYLDASRSVLMVLIVLIHACAVYAAGSNWLVVSPETSAGINRFADFLDLFVLAGFFVIAGILTMASALRHGAASLAGARMVRLVVPLIAAALVLNVPFSLWLRHVGLSDQPVASTGYWLGGGWVYHLWFLVNLALYTLIAVPLCRALAALAPTLERLTQAVLGLAGRNGLMLCLLLITSAAQLGLVTLAALAPWLYEDVFFNSSLYTLGHYFIFFALGLTIRTVPCLWAHYVHPAPVIYAVAILVFAVDIGLPEGHGAEAVLDNLAPVFLTFCLIQFLLSQFRLWFDAPAPLWRGLSDSSYSVYLFHHHVVALVSLALIPVEWPIMVEFVVVLVAGIAAGLAIHFALIARVPMLAFLFNGTPLPKSAAPPARAES